MYPSLYHVIESTTGKRLKNVLEVHFIDLEKLRSGKGIQGMEASLLRWLRFLASKSREELEMLARNDKELKGAYEDLKIMSADERLRREYEAREAWLMDERSRVNQARREGLAEGMEMGRAGGIIEVAQNALKEGMGKPLIQKLTGLSKDEIDKLEKDINR
ncbi:MAG TPA: PD-(D/E)XK nuclease family transposase [Anaerovoracaceae bacterium]|nr:PD-(D/E)XK nuclease family transposase [Anaerovoracaceae bacterium]